MDRLGKLILTWCGVCLCATAATGEEKNVGPRATIELQGEWQLRLDPQGVGVSEKWFETDLPDKIALPGTVTAAGLGTPGPVTGGYGGPQFVRQYAGRAWYRREVTIPQSWAGKHITLLLERTNWVTGVWVNGRFIGMRDSLAVPHVYDLGDALHPGRNHLAIMVDNTSTVKDYQEQPGGKIIPSHGPEGGRHCEERYNGILGRIKLEATDPVWIAGVDAYPDVPGHRVRARVRMHSSLAAAVQGQIVMQASLRGESGKPIETRQVASLTPGQNAVELTLDLGRTEQTWSEFTPRLWTLTATVSAGDTSGALRDALQVTFGMRQLSRDGTRLLLNGTPVFLRGRVDSAVFPLAGHAPMDVEGWRQILQKARDYGLNHFRFHSWCPPEAAFQAADEMGFLFHIEPSSFTQASHYEDTPEANYEYALAECLRIVEVYGNHPSFGFLSVGGNEQLSMGAPYDDMRERRQKALMARLEIVRKADLRRLYTSTTHPWTPGRTDDYYVTGWGKATIPDGHHVRLYGCNWGGPDLLKGSRFIENPPETVTDYRKELDGIEAPVITHEIGQWAVFPDITEISKYTGAYRAGNLERIRQLLEKNGLLEQARDFVQASGQLSLRLYREEVESALRTPGLAGFELLDLIDYPWQNTATVGVLDAFWNSKGLITPEAWREFCGPVVPLARLPKRTWTTSEKLQANVDVANYGPAELANASSKWTLSTTDGRAIAFGEFATTSIPRGGLTSLGSISAPLTSVTAPAKLMLTVFVGQPAVRNSYELWVYADASPPASDTSVQIFHAWNAEAKAALAAGGKVLVLPGEKQLANSLPGIFTPVYWSWLYFPNRQVGTMGLLCDPKTPALAEFPTEFHSNWQWWEPITHSRTMMLDSLPASLRPTLQVIDRFDTCRRLGVLFEARVGPGRLAVCSIDLENNLAARPVTCQLKRSLLHYLASDRFQPSVDIEASRLDAAFAGPAKEGP